MNRTYTLVWNHCLGTWSVADEHARRHAKGSGALLAAALLLSGPALAADLPTGGNVVSGVGQISTPNSNQMTIDQASNKLAIDWQSFDIAAGNKVTFNQPGTDSIALNRVLGADGSKIMGQLDANGRVFIINPNGVLFGQGASVNVGGLVASTLDLSVSDFEAGNYQFKGDGSNASVINQGTLTAADGGAIALLGGTVSNQGVIVANQGSVVLAAGNKVTLDFAGDGLLNVQVDEAVVDALVENHQLIKADGGQVLLTAHAGEALLRTVVNNTGVIEAQTLGEKEGKIVLLGSFDGGSVQVAGTLDASAPKGGNGGFIETSGAHVKIADGTKVTTKAESGKTGTWLIDPNDFTIAASGGDMSGAQVGQALQDNNFEIQTAIMGTAGGNGDIHINDTVSWSSSNTLTLTAEHNISSTAAIQAATGSLTLQAANGDITLNHNANQIGGIIALSGGDITLHNATNTQLGNVTANSLEVKSGGTIAQTAVMDITGTTRLSATDDISLADSSNQFGGAVSLDGNNAIIAAAGNLTLGTLNLASLQASAESLHLPTRVTTLGFQSYRGDIALQGDTTLTSVVGGIRLDGAINSNYGLSLSAGVSIIANGDVNVGTFTLQSGNWVQNSSALPSFSAKDFRLNGGSFLRALGGDGNSANPWLLTDVYGLQGMKGFLGNSFSLANDIDASGTATWNCNAGICNGFVPIGDNRTNNDASRYTGTFDGQGHVISDLNIKVTQPASGNYTYAGLFGYTGSGAQIRAIGLENAAVSASGGTANYAGGLVGYNTGSINQSYATGNVEASGGSDYNYAGGLVGYNTGSISQSYAADSVEASAGTYYNYAGGLVGYNTGSISQSYAAGSVEASAGTYNRAGGLVGHNTNSGSINQSHATGSVEASGGTYYNYAGGLVGHNTNSGSINQSHATGSVEASGGSYDNYAGGLVGYNTNSGSINQSHATGNVEASGTHNYAGGLVGYIHSSSISQSYATGSVEASGGIFNEAGGLVGINYGNVTESFYATTDADGFINNAGYSTGNYTGNTYGTGKTWDELTNLSTFAAWDIDAQGGTGSVWRLYEGSTTPLLRSFLTQVTVTADLTTAGKTYDGNLASGSASYSTDIFGASLDGSLGYATGSKNAGTYTVADGNLTLGGLYSGQQGYDISYANDTSLTIDKAAATVTANSNTVTYNGQQQTIDGFTVDGLVNGETASVLTGVTTTGGEGTNAGSYSLTASGTDGNYELTFVDGALTIDKAAATVTANSGVVTYNGLQQSVSGFTASGLVNGEQASVLSGVTTTGGSGTDAGIYRHSASGVDGNYALTFVDGALTIDGGVPSGPTVKVEGGTIHLILNGDSVSFTSGTSSGNLLLAQLPVGYGLSPEPSPSGSDSLAQLIEAITRPGLLSGVSIIDSGMRLPTGI